MWLPLGSQGQGTRLGPSPSWKYRWLPQYAFPGTTSNLQCRCFCARRGGGRGSGGGVGRGVKEWSAKRAPAGLLWGRIAMLLAPCQPTLALTFCM